MKKMLVSFFSLLLLIIFMERAFGASDELHSDIHRIVDALKNGDYRTVIDMTYPPIIKAMGGREVALKNISEFMNSPLMKTLKIHSFETEKPYKFVHGSRNRYVIIKHISVMEIQGKKVKTRGFQLGIYDKVKNRWTFISGEKLNEGILASLFSDFPKDINLPKVEKKMLN